MALMVAPAPLCRGGMGAIHTHKKYTLLKVSDDSAFATAEARILQHVGVSPFVVPFYGLRQLHTGVGIVLGRCGRSLDEYVRRQPGQRLPDPMCYDTQEVVVMMIACVADLHSRGVIHGDIKPTNFLRCDDGSFRLCDFGLSRLVAAGDPPAGCTPLYLSAGEILGQDEGYAGDWWTLGISLYQVLLGIPAWPFATRDEVAHMSRLSCARQLLAQLAAMRRNRPLLGGLPEPVCRLVQGLLRLQPSLRWSLPDVLSADYPATTAYSRVAARFPHLAHAMGKLVELRRHLRMGHVCSKVFTPDGRLLAPAFVPCKVRSDEQLVVEEAEVREETRSGCRSVRLAGGRESPPPRPTLLEGQQQQREQQRERQRQQQSEPAPARGPSNSDVEDQAQVQNLKVHEQMKELWQLMLERRWEQAGQAAAAAQGAAAIASSVEPSAPCTPAVGGGHQSCLPAPRALDARDAASHKEAAGSPAARSARQQSRHDCTPGCGNDASGGKDFPGRGTPAGACHDRSLPLLRARDADKAAAAVAHPGSCGSGAACAPPPKPACAVACSAPRTPDRRPAGPHHRHDQDEEEGKQEVRAGPCQPERLVGAAACSEIRLFSVDFTGGGGEQLEASEGPDTTDSPSGPHTPRADDAPMKVQKPAKSQAPAKVCETGEEGQVERPIWGTGAEGSSEEEEKVCGAGDTPCVSACCADASTEVEGEAQVQAKMGCGLIGPRVWLAKAARALRTARLH